MLTTRRRRRARGAPPHAQRGRMPLWAMLLLAAMIVVAVLEFVALAF